MTLDQIIKAFRDAASPPAEALLAAVPMSDALAPIVYARQEQACRGVCLMPGDDNLLFYGLHVLAAAKHQDLWPRLVELLRQPEEELSTLFADHTSPTMAALMLSVWDGDIEALLRLIEHADLCDDSKWALFDVLARLTFNGRIPRQTTVEFLERFERDGLTDDDSQVWWGWESCVTKLGIVDLRPALDRVRAKPAFSGLTAEDMADTLEELEQSAGGTGNAEAFDKEGICAIADPVEALQWLITRNQTMRQWDAKALPPPAHIANDPAREIRLYYTQEFWLERFLASRQVPPTTMPLPMLDGFLTALVIGPTVVPPHDYLPVIWGDGEDTAEPQWADAAQSIHVLGLIARIHGAILTRCNAGSTHVPLIRERYGTLTDARAWAEGFIAGIDYSGAAWNPLFEDRRGCEEALAVLAMADGNAEYFGRPATSEEVLQVAERLPRILQHVAAYWRDPTRVYPKTQPVRATKIGRNDPCPCGSGKKFKKCCALKEVS